MGSLTRRFSVLVVGILGITVLWAAPVEGAPPRVNPALRIGARPMPFLMNVNARRMAAPNQHINTNFMVAPGLSLGQAAFNIRVLGHAFRAVPPYALGYSPYASAMLSSYGYPMSMGYGGYGGYGSGSYPSMMSTGGYPDVAPIANPGNNAGQNPSSAGQGAGDGLYWPVALRILPPAIDTRPLREHLDSLMSQLQVEAGEGKVDPAHLREAKRDLDRLEEMWSAKADFLPISAQAATEGKAFLKKLRETLKSLE